MHINDLLKVASERKASDLHLKVGSHPVLRINGDLVPLVENKRLMQEDTIAMAFSIMSNRQKQKFKDNLEIDIAYSVPGLGRFRCNVFQQRGTVGLVPRVIPVKILTVRELGLPIVLEKICNEQRGLILCTGTTGSGKSTSLAAMIDYINSQRTEHVIIIEDPIELRCTTDTRDDQRIARGPVDGGRERNGRDTNPCCDQKRIGTHRLRNDQLGGPEQT